MKRTTILLPVFALLTLSVKAQKGSWYVGGNVGFSTSQNKTETSTSTTKNGKTTSWSLSPEFGTFLTEHVQLGLGLTASGSKVDYQSTPASTSTSNYFGATLYSRYFFGKEAFKPFVGVNVTAQPGKSKSTTGSTTTESKNFNFGANVNAGFGYALSKKVTAVGSFGFLGYNHNTSKATGSTTKYKSSSFGLDAGTLGNRFNVGFYYTL